MIQTANTQAASAPPPLIVLVSSFGGKAYTFNVAYGVGKAAVDRLANDMGFQLAKHNVATVSLCALARLDPPMFLVAPLAFLSHPEVGTVLRRPGRGGNGGQPGDGAGWDLGGSVGWPHDERRTWD